MAAQQPIYPIQFRPTGTANLARVGQTTQTDRPIQILQPYICGYFDQLEFNGDAETLVPGMAFFRPGTLLFRGVISLVTDNIQRATQFNGTIGNDAAQTRIQLPNGDEWIVIDSFTWEDPENNPLAYFVASRSLVWNQPGTIRFVPQTCPIECG